MKQLLFWTFLFLISFFVLSCENDMVEVAQYFSKEATKTIEAQNVEILYSDSAVVRVIVRAPRMLNHVGPRVREPKSEFPDGLTADFFDREHRLQSHLTASYGVKYDHKNQVIVRDSVVVTTVKNEKLETEELIWDDKAGKITTDKFVKVSTPKEIVYGYGLEAKDDFTYWKIQAVTGRLEASDIIKELKQ